MTWRLLLPLLGCLAAGLALCQPGPASWVSTGRDDKPAAGLTLNKGDRIVLIGGLLAERMQHFGHFETLLHSRFPDLQLVVRNLGWSADELTLRPRSANFKDHGHNLADHKPDVIVAAFGFNESYAGKPGLAKFEADLARFVTETTTTKYNGKSAPKLVLLSPIACEDTGRPGLPDPKPINANLELYTAALKKAAEGKTGVTFVDLLHPTLKLMADAKPKLTFNGVHLTDHGDQVVGGVLDAALFGARPAGADKVDLKKLRAEVLERNQQHWYDHRAVNGFYIYGGRKSPFGVVNFPDEFQKLRKMIEIRDARIWAVAQGKDVPATIDDSAAGVLKPIPTNYKGKINLTPAEESAKRFKLPKGFEVNLFASEKEFPDLQKPCQMTFDAKGRLWVCTMSSYPQYLPGTPVNDKILILEDTDGDGKADKCTVFADKLYLPTGIALGDGGAYVAQQPNLVFLKDTDGDGKADTKDIILSGFDSADSHHALSAFRWGPGGDLYFMEGTFHHSQVETPWGPTRLKDAGVFRYEPKTEKLDVFVSYRFANPWGICWDRWGQTFVADASGGANYFGTAFSGDIDYPNKRSGLKEFLKKKWRPSCGCVVVSSRNFPQEMQGDYLLNNCIGFLGVQRFKMSEADSGFSAEWADPLAESTDPNCRPVDLAFGPDGGLYVCDWFNPLVGHMQHSIRDPNRDKTHGRVWRIVNKNQPLLKQPKIDGAGVPELLDLLKEYEDSTRELARLELRRHPTKDVVAGVDKWLAGLDATDKAFPHHQLEALWVCQHHDHVHEALLKKVLRSPEPKARAAATRVLGVWRDRVKGALELLRTQVNDEHPRVRLEAVRALSFFRGADAAKAQEVAYESLTHKQDYYLEYTLKETLATLDGRIKGPKKK